MLLVIAYQAARKVRSLLEVILHMGAHRTGTTTLQRSLQQNNQNLTKNGVTVWGPSQTRGGLFSGLLRGLDAEVDETTRLLARNKGVIAIEMERLARKHCHSLLITEENILGGIRGNLRAHQLYPRLDERLARFAEMFGPVCGRIGLAIRPYQDFWASSLAHAIPLGHRLLGEDDFDRLVTQPRTWRRVINDVAAAFPRADIMVWEFGRMVAQPAAQLRILTNGQGKLGAVAPGQQHNASPRRDALRAVLAQRRDGSDGRIAPGDGRFMPMATHQIEAMQAQYDADLAWLRGVAVGRLKFVDMVETFDLAPPDMTKRGFG